VNRAPLFRGLFIGAGAMKAGTTWLYTMMARHPQLLFTPEKEIHYFYAKFVDDSLLDEQHRLQKFNRFMSRINPNRSKIDNVRQLLHWLGAYLSSPVDDYWYRNLFYLEKRHKYGCDFSNLQALMPADAWPEISAITGRLKVIYTMRRPIDRLWSHIKYSLEAENKMDQLAAWGPRELEEFCRRPNMWNHAEYGGALHRMKSGLKPNQLKVIFFEDVRSSPRETLVGLETFLGISPRDYPDELLSKRVNETSSQPMPAFLPDLFAADFERITREVEAEGLVVPASWRASAADAAA
jgi:hypothetical protein